MINVTYRGGFGNKLFQYFTAIILSEITNQSINTPFTTKLFDKKNKSTEIFREGYWVDESNLQHVIEMCPIKKNLNLEGFFQDPYVVSLFDKYKYLINLNSYTIDNIFVHVRLGDLLYYPGNKTAFASYNYYEDLLEKHECKSGIISSDSFDHPIVMNLIEKFNLKSLNLDEEQTIIHASKFKYKILSLGTFSWWIGYLGCQENIYFPNPGKYTKWHGEIHVKKHWNLI